MKNKRRLTTAIFMTIALILQLSGCQLAKEEGAAEYTQTRDRLIGVYITTEPLDLFDMERYLNDHADQRLNDSPLVAEPDITGQYSRRIYATSQIENGHEIYAFENLEGFMFIQPTEYENGSEISIMQGTDEISNTHTEINHTDTGKTNRLSGTIFVSGCKRFEIYSNPVYQTSDGKIYLTEGQGLSGDLAFGGRFSQSLKDEYTTTINGEQNLYSMEVTVAVEARSPVDGYLLMEMDSDNVCIGTQRIPADSAPDSITVHGETDYIIVINEYTDADGNLQKERQLFDISREDEPHISLFFPYEDPILTEHYINITFEGAA